MADDSKKEALHGIVAGILTERELTINIGSNQGVLIGMKFKILATEPIYVKDPSNGETLGTVDREKVRVTATEVQPKFTICRTYRKKTVGRSSIFDAIDFSILANIPRHEIPETLKAKDSSLPLPLSEEESYVKIGDRAIQLPKDEEEE
jgi:hypothetical protein